MSKFCYLVVWTSFHWAAGSWCFYLFVFLFSCKMYVIIIFLIASVSWEPIYQCHTVNCDCMGKITHVTDH